MNCAALRLSGVRDEARVVAIVVTERRREDVLVLEAERLPAEPIRIAAVPGRREEAEHCEEADPAEERRRFDRSEMRDLLIRARRSETAGARMLCFEGLLKVRQQL